MFGGKCFVLIENEHLGKFEAKARESIFLGYSTESKAYRVYVINQKKVIESININFDDGKLPSLHIEDPNETLKFENLPDSYLEIDDEPELLEQLLVVVIVRSVVFVEGGLNTNSTVLSKFVWPVLLFKYETNLRRKYKRNNI